MFLVRRSSWLLPGGVLLSVSFIVSSKPSIPFKPVPSDRGSASPPRLHSQTPPSLMNRLDWRLTWLAQAFYLYFWGQRFFSILTSCTKYTPNTAPSLPLPCYVKMTADFLSLLPCSRHALLILVFPETTTGLGWSELTQDMSTETNASSKHSIHPLESSMEKRKRQRLKSDKPGSVIQLLYAWGSFLLTHFTELRGFNEIITE